jgi:hypothetical protein
LDFGEQARTGVRAKIEDLQQTIRLIGPIRLIDPISRIALLSNDGNLLANFLRRKSKTNSLAFL